MAPTQRKQREKNAAPQAKPRPSAVSENKAGHGSSKKRVADAQGRSASSLNAKEDDEWLSPVVGQLARATVLIFAMVAAYKIRLHAVINFGKVIHEFDPWFNFRATQYLVDNGFSKFFAWYDEQSWYPLGRPIGTTIYPGLQFTAAALYWAANLIQGPFAGVTLNDVCVYIPALFGVLTTWFTYLLAYEVTGDGAAAVASSMIMAIIPSHLMRSVAGGFDNESIAVCAIVATFYLWCRSLRTPTSWPWGLATAASYVYMVCAWGGYTFVVNLIGLHAGLMALCTVDLSGVLVHQNLQAFTMSDPTSLHRAYSLFYVLGTLGAVFVPVVGWAPLRSLEQLAPLAVFVGLQLLQLNWEWRKRQPNSKNGAQVSGKAQVMLLAHMLVGAVVVGLGALYLASHTGYLGPLSSRVRGLFVKHTRTGNPLVDSVAEHQSTRPQMYWGYFHATCYAAPLGLALNAFRASSGKPAASFMLIYAWVAYYFSQKMVRLVLLLAAPASVLAGWGVVFLTGWCVRQFFGSESGDFNLSENAAPALGDSDDDDDVINDDSSSGPPSGDPLAAMRRRRAAAQQDKKSSSSSSKRAQDNASLLALNPQLAKALKSQYNSLRTPRQLMGGLVLYFALVNSWGFLHHAFSMAPNLSNPTIMLKGRDRNGGAVVIDDFREAYWWLRDNTPEDSRVMAWWDYGYQINGMANRTTIADGNTWNHEHIALLGKALVSPTSEGHKIAKHLADYVLVWSTRFGGMQGDDLAKSPHMARIGGSVYSDVKAEDFYQTQAGPSPMMKASLIYNLVNFRLDPSTPEDDFWTEAEAAEGGKPPKNKLFQEVYTTQNRMVRIYKVLHVSGKSKRYCAEGRGHKAWYEGRPLLDAYPPALKRVLSSKQDFAQLEDFNAQKKKRQQQQGDAVSPAVAAYDDEDDEEEDDE